MIDIFEKIEFKNLLPKSDRRGIIAVFYLKRCKNIQYIQRKGMFFIWNIISSLSEDYRVPDFRRIFEVSECNDCWLFRDGYELRLVHKYWSDKQIECFSKIIYAIAQLHDWKIEEPFPITQTSSLDGGILMSLSDFVAEVRNGNIIDDDGMGFYALSADKVSDIEVYPSNINFGLMKGWTHIAWYNK